MSHQIEETEIEREKMKKSRLRYLSSPTRVREKVGQPLRTSSSVEETILLHDQSSSPSRIYNPNRRRRGSASSSSKGKPLDLPWLRKDKTNQQRQTRQSGDTKLPHISSSVKREDYEKLQRECERLRRLLSERQSNEDSTRNDVNRGKNVGGEDQQLVQFNLGMQFKCVERMLNSLDNVFVDTARDAFDICKEAGPFPSVRRALQEHVNEE